MLAICIPYDEKAASVGNGTMVAIRAGSRAACDELYAKAIALGATCDGPPGERVPDFFYGAYVRDLDGNKLCFCQMGANWRARIRYKFYSDTFLCALSPL